MAKNRDGGGAETHAHKPIDATDPMEVWEQWYETMTDTWRQTAEVRGDPLGLTTQWLERMEEARAKLLADVKLPADPFTFFKQWYDATSETWSTIVGNIIGTEKFMEGSSEFLKSYTSFYGTLRRANEEFLRNLQLPTRTDIARVAELVVNLEDKVDRLDSALEDSEDRSARLATSESVEYLHKRVEDLEKRLDRVEGKLDSVLAALEKMAAREPAKSTEAVRRVTRKPHTQSKKSSGTEA
jgi:polyhydroxyalkanoic acid synthase PhaR subunit